MRCIGDEKTHACELDDIRWRGGPYWCDRHLDNKRNGPAKPLAHVSTVDDYSRVLFICVSFYFPRILLKFMK